MDYIQISDFTKFDSGDILLNKDIDGVFIFVALIKVRNEYEDRYIWFWDINDAVCRSWTWREEEWARI